jgi:predicted HAD superfamily Cof-like phosphohydrolase
MKPFDAVKATDFVSDIEAFHDKFEIAYYGVPRSLPEDLQDFRCNFMVEELEEYDAACKQGDLAKALDALVDLTYVVLGTAHLHGFNFNEAWARVHAANMKKVKGSSERSDEYDVIKPEGWTPPDLSDLI